MTKKYTTKHFINMKNLFNLFLIILFVCSCNSDDDIKTVTELSHEYIRYNDFKEGDDGYMYANIVQGIYQYDDVISYEIIHDEIVHNGKYNIISHEKEYFEIRYPSPGKKYFFIKCVLDVKIEEWNNIKNTLNLNDINSIISLKLILKEDYRLI